MKTLLVIFSVFCVLFSVSFTPVAAQVTGNKDFLNGIVPCGRGLTTGANGAPNPAFRACTTCDVFTLMQNVINFLLYAFASLTVLALVYIAILFMFSGGSSSKITEAKEKLWMILLGIFWVLGSWLVINTILNVVADPSVFPWKVWNKIDCSVSQPLSEQEVKKQLQAAGISVSGNSCPAGTDYQVVSEGCATLSSVTPKAVSAVVAFKTACGCPITVAGGSGDKIYLENNPQVKSFIESAYFTASLGTNSNQSLFRAPNGIVFALPSE